MINMVVPLIMNDKLKIDSHESQDVKWNRGLDIFIESVIAPDSKLRGCAHNQGCYNELMWVRENVLEFLSTLRRK